MAQWPTPPAYRLSLLEAELGVVLPRELVQSDVAGFLRESLFFLLSEGRPGATDKVSDCAKKTTKPEGIVDLIKRSGGGAN